jgi:hypothetical protein
MKRKNDLVFDSMNALHGATGIPLHEIKRCKKSGCKAFMAANRISLCALLLWLNGEGRKKNIHVVDVNAAKERDLIASAALKEQTFKKESGQLVPAEYVEKALRETLLPVRQRLLAMPSELAHNANPADPQHARKAAESWLEINLLIMQEPKQEGK